MRRLFRAFEREGVRYLLISGQASVLYGAATFSEDVDVWIDPSASNVRRLAAALSACRAVVYKLTPPMSKRNLQRGHGFHFVVPGAPAPTYLDIMGCPPRVGKFSEALRRSERMHTDWGTIPVVSRSDLIRLKQTQRLSDYEVISNLVRLSIDAENPVSRQSLRWAARATFRAEDRAEFLERLGERSSLEGCRTDIAVELARLQRRDSRYWRKRIADLRRMYRGRTLLPVGQPVARVRLA